VGPTSNAIVALFIIGALAATAATVLLWERGRGVLAGRIGVLVTSQLLVMLAGGALVNQANQLYTSWADLGTVIGLPDDTTVTTHEHNVPSAPLASPTPVRPVVVTPGALDTTALARWKQDGGHGSLMLSLTWQGQRTGYRLPVWVYLPAAYFSQPTTQFPVVELLSGYPGGPRNWLVSMQVQEVMDSKIAHGALPPTIAVLPAQNPVAGRDSECVDAVNGAQAATWLAEDVPDLTVRQVRAPTDRAGWTVMGYSTGGFCAVNLAFTHPARYARAASISGYFYPLQDGETGNLYRGDQNAMNANDPRWTASHRQLPETSLYLAASQGDRAAVRRIGELVPLLPPPVHATTATLADGGHNFRVWRVLEEAAWDWIGKNTPH
jgi:enterochelin esterase-like enzyme